MPLSVGQGVSLISLAFSKTEYTPEEPIEFQVMVEGEPTQTYRSVTFTGTVALPEQPATSVSGSTTVVDHIEYAPFSADGYTVVQDSVDPSRFTATPEVTP